MSARKTRHRFLAAAVAIVAGVFLVPAVAEQVKGDQDHSAHAAERAQDISRRLEDAKRRGDHPDIPRISDSDAIVADYESGALPDPEPVTTDNDWLTWIRPTPGMAVELSRGDRTTSCTVSIFMRRHDRPVGVTAGHCVDDVTVIPVRWTHSEHRPLETLG